MPRRHPQPFWRKFNKCWYVQIGKKQVRLAPDRTEAFQLYHELMSRGPEPGEPPATSPTLQLVVDVLAAFLDWSGRNQASRTTAHYRENLQRFTARIPAGLVIGDLKPYHVTRVLADFPHWAPNTRRDFLGALKRALNWAVAEELIERHPLAGLVQPAREARELVISPADYVQIRAAIVEPCFRDLIELAWETGARVQELRILEARFVDLATSRVVIPPSLAKGKKFPRVIYLTDRAREILDRLGQAQPTGPILLNSAGRPWTKDAINCAFCRLQKKLGRKFHLGAFRKGYATEALKNGVDVIGLAHLMGHRDVSMLGRVYARVQQDPEYMASLLRKARPGRDQSAGDYYPGPESGS